MDHLRSLTDDVKLTADSLSKSVSGSAESKAPRVQDKWNEKAWSMLVFYWICPNT